MIFNSIQYLIFLPIVIILYYLIRPNLRWILLLIVSYYFYMCWRAGFILLIILTTLINYFAGLKIYNCDLSKKKIFLVLTICSNLSILFFFKYFNFFSHSMNGLFQFLNIHQRMPYYGILLPVGISFYTFQVISYVIDVFRGKREPEKHLGIFAVFVSFFPQLVAGPIERSKNLIPQFHKQISFKYDNISNGVKMIIWGFFLKLVVADRAAIYVNSVYNNVEKHSGLTFMLATIFFGFQIYGDFAGYSFIAIGSSRLLGIDLMMNFNRPYLAASIQNFWQRWHISLSTWFRDYLYIPLGGNRGSALKWFSSILITFIISGIWHGANWTFFIWGSLHGCYYLIEVTTGKSKRKGLLNVFVTFILVNFAWIFFRANSIGDAFYIVKSIFISPGKLYVPGGPDVTAPVYAAFAITMLMLIEIKKEYFNTIFSFSGNKNEYVRMFSYASMLFLIFFLGVFNGSQFIYFQF